MINAWLMRTRLEKDERRRASKCLMKKRKKRPHNKYLLQWSFEAYFLMFTHLSESVHEIKH